MRAFCSAARFSERSVIASPFDWNSTAEKGRLLAACGRHKLRPDQIPAILEAADRRALPSPTAPPQGLALAHVEYPD